jgi:DNA mismatch repair protein MutL
LLPNEVVPGTAAGEEVESLASAVKDLVVNSLDARGILRARGVMAGGLDGVRVVGNGCGIPAAQAD